MKVLIITFALLLAAENASAQMFWNQACEFTGSGNSYVSCRNTTSINLTQNFTLEAWINPSTLSGSSQGIIAKGGARGSLMNYGMRLESSGRIVALTNSVIRLRSKASTALSANEWNHVSITHSFTTFSIYINGVFDTSATVAGSFPNASSDSLFIGTSGTVNPFSGYLDEVRIWNRALTQNEVAMTCRLSLGTNSGFYSGVVLSMTFQRENSFGMQFNVNDWSGNGNTGKAVNVSALNLSDRPSSTIFLNSSVRFNETANNNDYLAGPDNADVSPTTGITLQAWIRPISNSDGVIIHKGSPSGGAGTNYSMNIINRKLAAVINGVTYDSQDTISANTWTHAAFTYYYDGVRRYYTFYVDGKIVRSQFLSGGSNITDGADSVYIGGTIGMTDFRGYIDEVRISRYVKPQADILDSMYTSMENGNTLPGRTLAYTFDGNTYSNSLSGPFLYFRNDAFFTYPSQSIAYAVSPTDKGFSVLLQKAFCLKSSDRAIPDTGSSGGAMKEDSLNILLDETVSDVNVFVAINHNAVHTMQIDLVSPDGIVVNLLNGTPLLSGAHHVITVFDDNATLPMAGNSYTAFTPAVGPESPLNAVLFGTGTRGIWRLRVNTSAGNGNLYAWGLRFNSKVSSPKVLQSTSIIQGFYNAGTNTQVRDTMRCYIHSFSSPYQVLDSAKAFLSADGTGSFSFLSPSLQNNSNYYLRLKHRNSLETWSAAGISFAPLTSQSIFDFSADSTRAFGSNMIRVDNSPVKFAVYSGDVNIDGIIDAIDLSIIDNDVFNFSSGYLSTDVSGDDITDAVDAAITDNNVFNFVGRIRP